MSASSAQMIHVSAPGKLMLLGEHAVVHQRPCLVTAVDARLHMTLSLAAPGEDVFSVRAPDVGVEHVVGPLTEVFAGGRAQTPGTRFIESALAVFRDRFDLAHGVHITTRSDFSSRLGLGSSSATVACTLFGLARLLGCDLSARELFDLGWDAIFQVQRTGSGFDLAAAIYGGTLYYDNGQPRQIIPLTPPLLPLLVAYTGVKADTATYVNRVTERLERFPAIMNTLFDTMAEVVRAGRTALEAGDWAQFGLLMDMQHGLAHALGVDTAETAALVFGARAAGAHGAKLSGAGGGDCIIVLAPDERRRVIQAALETAGGMIVDVAAHAPGVRLDMEG